MLRRQRPRTHQVRVVGGEGMPVHDAGGAPFEVPRVGGVWRMPLCEEVARCEGSAREVSLHAEELH